MKWAEFESYLVALTPETPLGKMISIRSESDREVLKHFTASQHRISNEWRRRDKRSNPSPEQMSNVLEQLKQVFVSMAGGGGN